MFQVINPIFKSNDLNLPNDCSLVNFLLCGHNTLNVELNTAVLTATVNYIHNLLVFIIVNKQLQNYQLTLSSLVDPPHPQFPSLLCLMCLFFVLCASERDFPLAGLSICDVF